MKNKIIRKSNHLIEASYKLSVNQQKLVLMLAASISQEDENFQPYQIGVKDFAKLVGIKNNKNIYKEIHNLIEELQTKNITMYKEESVLQTTWLSSSEYFKQKGVLEICFDPKLKPYLLQLKNRFTCYKLNTVVQLRSAFSIRIYELLKQYEAIGKRLFTLSKLRGYLGIKENEYRYYGNFKQRILLPAQKELAEKTDISFEFEEIKSGRSVNKIIFSIFINNQKEEEEQKLISPFTPDLIENSEKKKEDKVDLQKLLTLLPEVFKNKKSIEDLILKNLEKHGYNYVLRNILYTNEKSLAAKPGLQNAKGSNYRNYLNKALKEDYGLAYQEDLEAASLAQKAEIEKAAEETEKQRKENAKIEAERDFAIQAKNYIESLDFEAKKIIEEEAIKSLSLEDQQMLSEGRVQAKFTLKTAMKKIVQERLNLTPKK